MTKISRRSVIGALTVAPLAAPAIIRAQTVSAPVTIGFLSDVSGVSRENGGPGHRISAEFAVADFGGSVLGRPIEVIQADVQNKPDIASSIAREWISERGVSLLADGALSSAALAIQELARDKKRIYVMTTPIANTLIGKQCSPYGFQFAGSSYAFAKGVTDSLTRRGGDTWMTVVVDNEFGYTLERDIQEFVKVAGGKAVGAIRIPLGTTDFSSYLLQAKGLGAKVIGLGMAGSDLQNCIKQAAEFGTAKDGQQLATPILTDSDVAAIGQEACKGLRLSSFFNWTLTPETRAYGKRYIEKASKPPTLWQMCSYLAVTHWLKAVKAANTLDADAVAAKMRETPVDFFKTPLQIYANGCVPYPMHLLEVKSPSELTERFDYFKLLSTVSSADANPPPAMYGCPLVKT